MDEQWEKGGWREFVWKMKLRYFNTPAIASKYSDTSEICWRGCGLMEDIFSDWPKILDFWKNILKEMKPS